MGIKWVDHLPEPGQRGRKPIKRPKHYEFAQALRGRPGAWAEFQKSANPSVAYQIKTGQRSAFLPAGAFEAVCRNTQPDGRGTIYVRYLPTEVS